jgi:integrase
MLALPRARRASSSVNTAAAWVAWLGGRPTTTVRARVGDLASLGRFLRAQGWPELEPRELAARLAEISPSDARALIAAWHTWMVVQENTGTTIARRISTLASWFRELAEHGLEWTVRLPRPRVEPYQRGECPRWSDVEELIDELEREKRWRELVAVLLVTHVGLRRAESCSLDLRDVLEGPPPGVRVVRKGGARIVRTISLRCYKAIRELANGRTRGPVLVSHVGRALTPEGLREITRRFHLGSPHTSRHSGAVELARRSNGNAKLVQDWLGHRHLSTTQRYLVTMEDHAGEATRVLAGE